LEPDQGVRVHHMHDAPRFATAYFDHRASLRAAGRPCRAWAAAGAPGTFLSPGRRKDFQATRRSIWIALKSVEGWMKPSPAASLIGKHYHVGSTRSLTSPWSYFHDSAPQLVFRDVQSAHALVRLRRVRSGHHCSRGSEGGTAV